MAKIDDSVKKKVPELRFPGFMDDWEDRNISIFYDEPTFVVIANKDGLPKQMDFNEVDESFIQSIASKRNNIPRKSLNYKTPIEVFLSHIKEELSNLI